MKKLFITLFTLFLFGCNETYNWEFKHTSSKVQQISIINIETHLHNAEEILNIPPIKTIEQVNAEEFYDEIINLGMKKRFNMELPFQHGYCFIIDYGNNEYCILSYTGSGYIYYDEESKSMINETTDYIFDNEEFKKLLNKYLNIN